MAEREVSPRRTRPGATRSNLATDDFPSSVGQTADHFVKRLLLDIINEQTAAYWNRRAETFARIGTSECQEIARACRARASLCDFEDHRDIVAAVLREVA